MRQVVDSPKFEELRLEFPGLYDWQYEALEVWREHERRGVIEAVTGAGKTRVGVAAIHEAVRHGIKVLVLVPNTELQSQWVGHIRKYLSQVNIGRLGGTHADALTSVDVLVAIVHSAATRETLRKHRQGLVIADECHRYAAKQFRSALQSNYKWRLGLTATYQQRDGGSMPLDEYFGGVIYRIWYREAHAAGIISKFDIAFIGVQFSPGEKAAYEKESETISSDGLTLRTYLEEIGLNSEEDFHVEVARLAESRTDDPINRIARRYQAAVAERQRLLANTPAKTDALSRLVPAVKEANRSLIFGHSKDAANVARAVMLSGGVPAEAVMSGMKKADRIEALAGFRSGRLRVLSAPRVLDEGVDIPEADLAIITSATRTERQTVQRLGRVIRKKSDGGIGRLAYLYVAGTTEDPYLQANFLPSVVPHSRRTRKFRLPDEERELLEFLRPHPRANHTPSVEAEQQQEPLEGEQHESEDRAEVPIDQESCAEVPSGPALVLKLIGDDDDDPQPTVNVAGATTDPVKDWRKRIGKYPLLSSPEVIELAKWIEAGVYAQHLLETRELAARKRIRELREVARRGERAREKFLLSNQRLVVSLAKRYVGRGLPLLDLIQEGSIGLYRAVQKFDHERGQKFSTYATWWIRQSISRAIDDKARLIRLPVHVHDKLRRLRATQKKLSSSAALHVREIAFMADLEPEEIPELERLNRSEVYSLDKEYVTDQGPEPLGALLWDVDAIGPERFVEADDLRTIVDSALNTLGTREATILSRRFGLTDGVEWTLHDIGQSFGITRERVRQLEKIALSSLRNHPGVRHRAAAYVSDSEEFL